MLHKVQTFPMNTSTDFCIILLQKSQRSQPNPFKFGCSLEYDAIFNLQNCKIMI